MDKFWYESSACLGVDTELFFGGSSRVTKRLAHSLALEFCGVCPVRSECFEDAMSMACKNGVGWLCGVFGGMTPDQLVDAYRAREGEVVKKDALKKCRRCGLLLSVDLFSKNIAARDGVQNWCRGCRAEVSREYRRGLREASGVAGPVRSPGRPSRAGPDVVGPLVLEGLSTAEIVRRLGVSRSAVRRGRRAWEEREGVVLPRQTGRVAV